MPRPDPLDVNTRSFLRHVGVSLTVLRDPTPAPPPAVGPDTVRLRMLAGHLRQHTLDHLDAHLSAATAAVVARGGTARSAADAAAARAAVADLTADGASVVRSPLTDEVGLSPSTGTPATAVVVAATFVVAATGQLCLTGDAATVAAPVLICLAGIESVVPRLADLAVMLKVAAPSPAGATAVVGPGPSRTVHLIWVDNGRTELLAGEHRAALRCVGCGACTAACPVYTSAGVGPAGLWAGPIGAIVGSALGGPADLPHASTLCGACADACPVRIDLPTHLIALRRRSPVQVARLRWWGWLARSPARFRWAARWQRWRLRRARQTFWPTPPRQSFADLWRERQRSP